MIRVARRLLTVALVALVAAGSAGLAGAHTDGPPRLSPALARALAVPHVSVARTGALAVDLATGRTLFAVHPTLPLAPASNEKLAVTFAALRELGPAYEIDTDVVGDGTQDGTTWDGNLVLQGHGDPTLTSAGLVELAREVAGQGILRVTGRIVADESYFDARRIGPGWKPSFYIYESPPLSALTVNRAWTGRSTSRDPALAAGAAFRAALVRAGVSVAGGVAKGVAPGDDTSFLATVDSPPLARILQFMDRASDNYTAELLLKQLGTVAGVQGSSASGAAVVRQSLAEAGVPLGGVVVADGSGLSLLDRTTAATLAGILRAAWNDPTLRAPFFDALSVAGENGTLADRMRTGPARGNVVGKTGTTNEASALSGYARRRYAFAVLQNGYPVAAYWARVAQDRFATVLARS
jgi:serine-type D-Ala-D-Ala carboxypeptidase/endopeptidase (penicillin-binding protein 4)